MARRRHRQISIGADPHRRIRRNRPIPSRPATETAASPPAALISAPILSSDSVGPGPTMAVAKNSATVKPTDAMSPTTTTSRQPTPFGKWRPIAARETDADGQAERFAEKRRQRQADHAPVQGAQRYAGRHDPEEQQHHLRGCRAHTSKRLSGSCAPAGASTKNPRSRAACGTKGRTGTRAKAGSSPPK